MIPIRPEDVKRILVRGTNWVGDAIMSVPAMKEIRRVFPGARISLLVRPWVRDVYSAAAFVDEVLLYESTGIHSGMQGRLRMAATLRRRSFDLAILLQNAFDAALIARLAGIPQRVGYSRDWRSMLLTHACRIPKDVLARHQVYYYLGILAEAGLIGPEPWRHPDRCPSIAIAVNEADREAARGLLREEGVAPGELLIGINPGAFYGPAKRWYSDRYAAVADALIARYRARVVLLGSQAERGIAIEVAGYMREKPIILAGRTTLGHLMGVLGECRLLITNDSGPMHLAAALDVPQLAIFGSTDEIATGPLSARAVVVKEPVDCSPCLLRECPIDFRCMSRITVDRVFEEACRILDGGSNSRL